MFELFGKENPELINTQEVYGKKKKLAVKEL
jgi:hypothetical protein